MEAQCMPAPPVLSLQIPCGPEEPQAPRGRPQRPVEPAPSRRRPIRSASGTSLGSGGGSQLHTPQCTPPPSPYGSRPLKPAEQLNSDLQHQTPYTAAPVPVVTPPTTSPMPATLLNSTPLYKTARPQHLRLGDEVLPTTATPAALVGSPSQALRHRRHNSSEAPRKAAAQLLRPTALALEPLVFVGNHTGPNMRVSPSMTMSWRAGRNLFAETFSAFCGTHQGLNLSSFVKLCKHCFLLDEYLSSADAEVIFGKVVEGNPGDASMNLSQFEDALNLVSEQKGLAYDTVRRAVTMAAGPTLRASCAAAGLTPPESQDDTTAPEILATPETQEGSHVAPEVHEALYHSEDSQAVRFSGLLEEHMLPASEVIASNADVEGDMGELSGALTHLTDVLGSASPRLEEDDLEVSGFGVGEMSEMQEA